VRIVNHDEYEKNQRFTIKLGDPRQITADKPGTCASVARCLITGRILCTFQYITNNSSADDVANVNFVYDDIAHIEHSTRRRQRVSWTI